MLFIHVYYDWTHEHYFDNSENHSNASVSKSTTITLDEIRWKVATWSYTNIKNIHLHNSKVKLCIFMWMQVLWCWLSFPLYMHWSCLRVHWLIIYWVRDSIFQFHKVPAFAYSCFTATRPSASFQDTRSKVIIEYVDCYLIRNLYSRTFRILMMNIGKAAVKHRRCTICKLLCVKHSLSCMVICITHA